MTRTITSYFIMPLINPWDSEEDIKKTYMFLTLSPTPVEAWNRFIGYGHEKHDRASYIHAARH